MPKTPKKTIINILDLKHDQALVSAIMDFVSIKSVIKGLEAELDAQKSIIMEYARTSKVDTIQFDNSFIDYVPGTRYNSVNKDKFKLNLLNSGVAAETISDCEKSATEERERSSYLKFSEKK